MIEAPHSRIEPPWMPIARAELGVKERAGAEDNPRILEYLRTVGLAEHHDETPWCSAFVNWCLRECGIDGTNDARARSWLAWGVQPVNGEAPRPGAIAVFWRIHPDSAFGHVGFYCGEDEHTILVLGGNQQNAVSMTPRYPKVRLLGYRWPQYKHVSRRPPVHV